MKRKILVASLVLLGLSSCAMLGHELSGDIKKPTFRYVTYEVGEITPHHTTVNFVLSCYNPNSFGLDGVTLGYELSTENHRFLQGKDIQVELKANDTTRIIVPTEVPYGDALRAAGTVAAKIAMNNKSLPVRIDAVLACHKLITFSLKVSQTVDVPLGEVEEELQKKARSVIHKLL
ncbi:MAG TPA: LEA type 2 family protein [Fibrobacteria bacterium]|nr:LEA type 2 family protein [Fibrobacteria bacterium]